MVHEGGGIDRGRRYVWVGEFIKELRGFAEDAGLTHSRLPNQPSVEIRIHRRGCHEPDLLLKAGSNGSDCSPLSKDRGGLNVGGAGYETVDPGGQDSFAASVYRWGHRISSPLDYSFRRNDPYPTRPRRHME